MTRDVDFGLYLITDRRRIGGRDLCEVLKQALDGGIRAVQLREKDLPGGELFRLAERLRALTLSYTARLFVNDRVDVALAVDADGVHLGQRSFSATDARRLVGKERLIGVSTHNIEEALKAERDGADFVTFGPVYHTPSKAAYGEPVGLEPLERVVKLLKIPVFAIGGIKKDNIREVLNAGAGGVALISAVLESPEVRGSAAGMIGELGIKTQRSGS